MSTSIRSDEWRTVSTTRSPAASPHIPPRPSPSRLHAYAQHHASSPAHDAAAALAEASFVPLSGGSDNIHWTDGTEEQEETQRGAGAQQIHLHQQYSATAFSSAAPSSPPLPLSKVIRFRVIKLSRTGMYTEKVLALDPAHHVLLFADPPAEQHQQGASQTLTMEAEGNVSPRHSVPENAKGFAMRDIRALMPFDDAAAQPSAPMPTHSAAFTSRLLMLFQPELLHRSYEVLFQDQVQRNCFLAVVAELYGSGESPIEILHCDEAPSAVSVEKGPRWIPDGDVSNCMGCKAPFSLMFRKHHCRSCGGIFCGPCSEHNASLPDLSYSRPVRVCTACFRLICDVRKQGLMIAGATGPGAVATPTMLPAQAVERLDAERLYSKRSSLNDPSRNAGGGLLRPAMFQPSQLNRVGSTPLSPPTDASPDAAGNGSAAAPPLRDIYGFLLSSPTLALASIPHAGREQTVLHVASTATPTGQQTPNGIPLASSAATPSSQPDDSAFLTRTAFGTDAGNSTLSPSASVASPSGAGGASSDAAARAQAALTAQQQLRLSAQHVEIEAQRDRWNRYLVLHTTIDRNSTDLKRLVRKGIPPELRGQVWQILSGSREKQLALQQAHARRLQIQLAAQAAAGRPLHVSPSPSRDHIKSASYYRHCLECSQVPENLSVAVGEIDKDLHRTFPDNALFETTTTAHAAANPSAAASQPGTTTTTTLSAGLNMLRRVLLAYSFHCPHISYCQSMNFITALLLLFMDEEDAFYLLIVILEDICSVEVTTNGSAADGGASAPSSAHNSPATSTKLYYHSPDLSGAHIDSKVFLDLISEKLPRVSAQFEKLSFPLAPLTMSWFLCLFV